MVAIFHWMRDRLTSVWREDARVAAVLTPPFLKEFKAEFDRMVRERREGIDAGVQDAAVLALMHADGWEMPHRLFDVLIKQYPRIDALHPLLRPEVVMRLMQHCDLPGSGLL
jgi:hypothetical protein